MAQTIKHFSDSASYLLTVMEAADFLHVSRRTIFYLISKGVIPVVRLSARMTRIHLSELQKLTDGVASASSSLPYNNMNSRERNKPSVADRYSVEREQAHVKGKPETGKADKRAKCRNTPASDIAPEGVTHETHYTLAEVMRNFSIKYGRFYEVRNRYQLPSVHAWGTTAFKKEDVEDAITKYDEEQGRAQQEAYYTCFDIMQKFGLGKTQVRRFAETHGVRIKKAKGGRANLYLKADWDAARQKATEVSPCTKKQRERK